MNSQFKKYRIIYSFHHSRMGWENSITIIALNVDDAIKDAQKQVAEVYGSKMLPRFTFKPDPVYSGIVL